MSALLSVHAVATVFMAGVIWFVQIVHYPLMDRVGRSAFAEYEREHTRRTSWVVAPVMLVELAAAAVLAFRPPEGIAAWQTWSGLVLLVVIWLSTGLAQVPRHRSLESGFDRDAHAGLVGSNWVRTLLWSARSVLAVYWLA